MARFYTANDIINRAAVECGINPSSDPVASTDETFVQFKGLLDGAGQELVEMHDWQGLRKKFNITTQAGDTGSYPLPDDFSAMINQTGWDETNRLPVGGPLSAQTWSYLDGLDFLNSPIYVTFQLEANKFQLYPQPPPVGLDIAFQYQSRNWVTDAAGTTSSDSINTGSDLVMLEPILMIKMLKAMFRSAKGFDATEAKREFEAMFLSRTGRDKGAQVLTAGGVCGYPYLSAKNVPWTNYGF